VVAIGDVVGKPHQFDVELLGNCDAVIGELCGRLEWALPGFGGGGGGGTPGGGEGGRTVPEPAPTDRSADVDVLSLIKSAVEEGKIVRHG